MPETPESVTEDGSTDSPKSGREQQISNWLPVAVLGMVAGWIWISRASNLRHPLAGVYIGVLALLAAIVTLWPPDNRWAKAAWFIVFGAFLVLEVSTLYKQHAEDLQTDRDKTKDEDTRFAGLLKTQQDNFAEVLHQNQREFEATMGEVRGSSGYVWFLALARTQGDLPVMMGNDNKAPVRGVDLEIVTIPPRGATNRDQQIAYNVFNPRLVHIGDVSPGFKQASFTLSPGQYDMRIITRLGVFNERIQIQRGPSIPNGWQETYCVVRNNTSSVLRGVCPDSE